MHGHTVCDYSHAIVALYCHQSNRMGEHKRNIHKGNTDPTSSIEIVIIIQREIEKISTNNWQNYIHHITNIENSWHARINN